jgi:hypothetical protein
MCASCSRADGPNQIAAATADAERAGISTAVVFAGQRPAEEIPRFLDAADVLVSPRSSGTNTPLKIYQYLRSGRPIVATRLLTHTQVLNDEVAILTRRRPKVLPTESCRPCTDEQPRARGRRSRPEARRHEVQLRRLSHTYPRGVRVSHRESTPQVAGGVA